MIIKRYDLGRELNNGIGMAGITEQPDGRYVLYAHHTAKLLADHLPASEHAPFIDWLRTRHGSPQDYRMEIYKDRDYGALFPGPHVLSVIAGPCNSRKMT